MFVGGTQAKKWLFKNEETLDELREQANKSYIENYVPYTQDLSEADFLSPGEEKMLFIYFGITLIDFCKKFSPPMPKRVWSCALHYYQRFYLKNSVMDYHPKDIIVTCVFLASKVEEFNVSISQFVSNVRGDRAKATDIILGHEHILMQNIDYDLIVHHPFRPVEGFLIDMKTRCPKVSDPDRFRPAIEEFLSLIYFTDAYLLFAPSQIALAGLAYAGRNFSENLIDSYVVGVLLKDSPKEKVSFLTGVIMKLLSTAETVASPPPRNTIISIEKKLEKCRNKENNPNSSSFKRKMLDDDEDDEAETAKYQTIAEEQEKDRDLLGVQAMEA